MILDLKTKRTAKNAWLNCIDPLSGLSITQAKSIFNAARRNGSPLLQKIFAEIEAADPILMTCVERRQSALAGLGWSAVAFASATDEQRAEVQRRALEDFANNIENLDDAIEHLDLGFFRGHSIVQPIWSGHAVRRISLLDSWNFLRDDDGNLLWNPGCSSDPAECDVITPAARIVALVRSRAIDWPALIVYIRKYIGERDWGRFLERYGIPPVDAVMSPNSTNEQKAEYVEGAEAARDGRSVVWPSGTVTSRAEGARGQDPFSPFVQHQEKQIVLMATGGTLTSLAQADTGALAGGAQMDVWEQIVARDGVMISTILNRGLFAPFLRERFPGEPVLAKFKLGREDTPSANEAADLAGKIKTAGYTVDQSQLEAATGFTLVKDEISTSGGFGGLSLNKAHGQTPLQNAHKPLQNAPRVSDGQGDPQGLPPSQIAKKRPSGEDAVLEAFAKDTSPAGKAIAALLQNPSKEAAEKLIADLPTLLPKEPDLAAVIADAMAAEFAKELGEGEMLANVQDAQGNEHSEADGKFTSKGASGAPSSSPSGRTEIRAVISSPVADAQTRAIGYADVKDMMAKAANVPAERMTAIQAGYSGKCKAHEAIAVISANKPFKDVEGNDVKFGNDIIEHYVQGRRRRDNMPKISNLEDLPYAIKAVKTDTYGVSRLKYPRGTTHDPLDPPRGTQREYHLKTDRGQMRVFVYIQGGFINGWHVEG